VARALVHFAQMNWKRLLAYITGSVDQELLLRNEYLGMENRILRNQIQGRLRLTDPERISLAEIGKRLGRKALEEVAQIVRPETILGWHRKLIAKKFDGSNSRLLAFMRVESRKVCIAGVTVSPDSGWMQQMARIVTLAEIGFLDGCRYLLHDRDAKFCAAFDGILESVGIKAVRLPPRSPNLNAHCERWIRSVKSEVLSKLILFGERSLRHCLDRYVSHYHTERTHQGRENVILFPQPADRVGEVSGKIRSRERFGGLLRFYFREAA